MKENTQKIESEVATRLNSLDQISSVDSDDLWSSIEKDLDRKPKRLGWLLFLCFIIGVMAYYSLEYVFEGMDNQKLKCENEVIINDDEKVISKDELPVALITDIEKEYIEYSNGPATTITESMVDQFTFNKNFSKEDLVPSSQLYSENLQNNKIDKSSKIDYSLVQLARIKAQQSILNYNPRQPSIQMTFIPAYEEEIPVAKKYFSAYVGTHSTHLEFSSGVNPNLASLRNEFEESYWGQNFGFDLGYKFSRNLSVSSGLEYNTHKTRFRFEDERTISVFKEDQLVGVDIDEVTGDTLQLYYADTTISAVQTRNILHHNLFRSIVIPLNLNYHYSLSNFEISLGVGGQYERVIKQSGRMLDSSLDVVYFGGSSGNKSIGKSFFSLRINPRLSYTINDNNAFTIGLTFSQSFKNMEGALSTASIKNYGVRLGYSYSW